MGAAAAAAAPCSSQTPAITRVSEPPRAARANGQPVRYEYVLYIYSVVRTIHIVVPTVPYPAAWHVVAGGSALIILSL